MQTSTNQSTHTTKVTDVLSVEEIQQLKTKSNLAKAATLSFVPHQQVLSSNPMTALLCNSSFVWSKWRAQLCAVRGSVGCAQFGTE